MIFGRIERAAQEEESNYFASLLHEPESAGCRFDASYSMLPVFFCS